ncbi:MAG: acyl carrier protein [Pseudomonadota bacterium]
MTVTQNQGIGMTNGDLDFIMDELRRVAKQPEDVRPEASVTRDLGLDSLAVMNLIMVLEDEFDILIPMDRLADVETVHDLAVLTGTLKETNKNECA